MSAPPGAPPIEWAALRRLLVVRLDNIGDVVMTGPTLRALRAAAPGAAITLMASPGGAAAAELLPDVDDVFVWRALWQDLGKLPFDPARERALVADLRGRAFDAAVVLTSFSQSPHPVALVLALAGVPVRLGESKERGALLTHALPAAPDALHQAERNLRLVEAFGVPVASRDLRVRLSGAARATARRLAPEPYLLLNPWASCSARTYDPGRFADAARLVADRTGLRVAVVGTEKDRDRAAPLLDRLGGAGLDLVGRTTLPEFAALVAGARLVLTNNTSSLHLADALRVPQLVMYAGTELESQWRPRASRHRLLRRETACSPCYAFACPYRHECLAFTAEEVADAALDLLRASPQGSSVTSSPR